MAAILDGIRVLDFGRYIAAPFCCQLLADMGAEVIRVERPGGEADHQRGPVGPGDRSLYFVALNRNKKAITLNLDAEEGRSLLTRLAQRVDVLVHNLPVQRAQALGLDYDSLQQANPRLVYLAVSGFGTTGPYARYTAFDAIVQAMTGAMTMTGLPGNLPTLSHIPYVDFGTALYGALAVVSALYHRERTGRGQMVDLALFATGLSFVGAYGIVAEQAVNAVVRRQVGNDMIYGVGGCYPAQDGYLVIQSLSNALWRRLCLAIERPDLLSDPRLQDDLARYQHREVVNEAVSQWTSPRPLAEAVRLLAEAGIPVGPVQSVDQLQEDPQAQALGMLPTVEQLGLGPVPVAGPAIKFSETPGRIVRPAPEVGEHNREVYGELLGLDEGELARLAQEGVI
ncbi:MAG: CaiB/BaiF CoA transferase family protein [Dehalococcoidia bacterium]